MCGDDDPAGRGPPGDEGAPTDDELWRRFCAGDGSALDRLVRRHLDWAWGCAFRITRQPATAEDLVQEAWLKLVEKPQRYRPQGRLRGFLKTVLARLWVDRTRQPERRQVALDDDLRDATEDVAALLAAADGQAAVWRATAALPPAQRQALVLRTEAGLGYAEIAEALGSTPKAVEMLLRRARRTMIEARRRAAARAGEEK